MITIRRAVLPADPAEAFIVDTLVRSYADAANGGRDGVEPRELAHALFRELPEHVARKTLKAWLYARLTAGARLWLAYDDGDPNEPLFVGWVCADARSLHYVYVKRRFRKNGIAGSLIWGAMQGLGSRFGLYSINTWPWVERWLARNGLTYQPIARNHEQEEQAPAVADAG